MARQPYRFLFILGASGSGTTMLTRLLSAPEGCVGLGGNHISIPRSDRRAYALARRFKRANDRLWDRRAPARVAEAAGPEMLALIDRLLAMPGYRRTSHVAFKRSAPFHRGDRYRPDLSDLWRLFDDPRLIVVHRDPRASTASSHRRRFAANLRAAAVITDEQLTYISAQLATLDPRGWLGFTYEELCRRPAEIMGQVADFVGLPRAGLERAIVEERVDPTRNDAWRQRLTTEEVDFLERYFDGRRERQWPLLGRTHLPGDGGGTATPSPGIPSDA